VQTNTCQEQGRHNLRGFSIDSLPDFKVKFKKNQTYLKKIRKLKNEKLSAI
jgi:hypothetical protein